MTKKGFIDGPKFIQVNPWFVLKFIKALLFANFQRGEVVLKSIMIGP